MKKNCFGENKSVGLQQDSIWKFRNVQRPLEIYRAGPGQCGSGLSVDL